MIHIQVDDQTANGIFHELNLVSYILPQAKLVIEIDGQQHKTDQVSRVGDTIRDNYLNGHGITTIRISTVELRNETYKEKTTEILEHLDRYKNQLEFYKKACAVIENNKMSEIELKKKMLNK